jgi:hypothetical protein
MRRALGVQYVYFPSLLVILLFTAVLLTGCGSSNKSTLSNTGGTPGGANGGGTGPGGSGGTGGTGGTGGGTGSGQPTVAYVYVGGNNFGGSALISGFNITADAVAHPLPGSPYSGPAGSVVTNGAYVFATDGTNIQTYTRNPDGSLVRGPSISGVAHNDTPIGSGVGPLTLDRTGQNLYVGEINFQGADNDAIAEFAIGSGGVLNFLTNSTINVDFASPLTFSQDNHFAYGQGCYFINFDLFGLARQANGTLQPFNDNAAIPPTSSPNETVCPESSSASAKNYLALEAGIVGTGNPNYFLVTYRINSDGTLSLVPNSNVPVTTGGVVAFDPSGNYLAIAGSGGVQVFQLNASGVLAPLGTPQQTSVKFDAVRWDSSGHLYAIGNSALYVFNFAQGVLTEAGSPYPVSSEGSLTVLPSP